MFTSLNLTSCHAKWKREILNWFETTTKATASTATNHFSVIATIATTTAKPPSAYLMWLSPGIGRQFGFYIFYVRWAYDFVKLFSHKKNSSIWLSAAFAVVLLTNSSSKWKFVCTADWWINIGDHLFKARVKARTSWFIETIFTTAWVSYTTSCDAWLLFISFQYNTRICKYDEGWVLIKGNDIFSYNSIRTFLIFHRYNYFSLSQK